MLPDRERAWVRTTTKTIDRTEVERRFALLR
jgi:hypothetical protein